MSKNFRALDLSTPNMGHAGLNKELVQHIKNCQWLLQGNNRYNQQFYAGERDGVYGPQTAAATKKAKYLLGFPDSHTNHQFGETLFNYLIPKSDPRHKLLPLTYQARRKSRLKAESVAVPRRVKVLNEAITQIGTKENPPYSNSTKYTQWYGVYGPWCAMFISWCYAQEGGHFRYSYVPNVVYDAAYGNNHLTRVYEPLPGDLACYDWNGDGEADHIGIFEKWLGPGTFQAVEGNTAIGNDSDGGEVMRRERTTNLVQAFVRVHD